HHLVPQLRRDGARPREEPVRLLLPLQAGAAPRVSRGRRVVPARALRGPRRAAAAVASDAGWARPRDIPDRRGTSRRQGAALVLLAPARPRRRNPARRPDRALGLQVHPGRRNHLARDFLPAGGASGESTSEIVVSCGNREIAHSYPISGVRAIRLGTNVPLPRATSRPSES